MYQWFSGITQYFKEIRNMRLERYSKNENGKRNETNKLLIRLDKLLNNLPTDVVERKGIAQPIILFILQNKPN